MEPEGFTYDPVEMLKFRDVVVEGGRVSRDCLKGSTQAVLGGMIMR